MERPTLFRHIFYSKRDMNVQQKFLNWLRRPQVWGFFVSMAVMAVISVAFFAPDNFDGASLNQADTRQGAANGQEGLLYEQLTGEKALWTGSLFSGMPTFQISPTYASNSLFTWLNDVYGLWLPAPSNLLYMMMFGFFIMLCCMRVPWPYGLIGAVAWGFSSYFTILIGAGHIWKYLALTFIPPTVGGLVLAYRGRYVAGAALTSLFAMLQLNANHPQMSYYFAFVMFGLAVGYLIIDLRKCRIKRWLTATVVVALSGVLAVGANLPSLYNTYQYAKETKRAQSELTPLVTGDNAAPERPTGGLPKQDIVNWSYGTDELFTFLIPNVKGGATALPQKGQMQMLGLDRLDDAKAVDEDIQPLLGYFTQYFNDSEGTNGPVYAGCIVLALFLLGCIICRGPMKWVLIVLTAVSVLLALGRNFSSLTDFMIYNFPMYSKFRAVESILVIAEFTIPLLGVFGLLRFMRGDNDEADTTRHDLTALAVAFGLPAAVCLLAFLSPGIFGGAITSTERGILAQVMQQSPDAAFRLQNAVESLRLGMVRADALRSLVFLLLAGGCLAAFKLRKVPAMWAGIILGVLILADLYPVSKRYVNHDSFVAPDYYTATYYDPFAPDAIDNAILADSSMSYRVMDIPGFNEAKRSYRHKMIGGYHAAKLNRYEDLIQRRMLYVQHYGYMPELRDDSVMAQYSPDEQKVIASLRADYRVLDMLNARYIITGDENEPLAINPYAMGNAWFTGSIKYVDNADQEMEALSVIDPSRESVADKKYAPVLGEAVAVAPGDTIALTHYSPNRLTYSVDSRNGGIGVFSEVWFPWGWKAKIDDAPASLGRVNYVLRALRLPPGRHTVTMTFDPDSIKATEAVAYACVTIIYLVVIFSLFVAFMRHEERLVIKK